MRTEIEIQEAIDLFSGKTQSEEVAAILDVLENDLDFLEIESKYQDDNDPWVEQAALSAREFLDEEIEMGEIGY